MTSDRKYILSYFFGRFSLTSLDQCAEKATKCSTKMTARSKCAGSARSKREEEDEAENKLCRLLSVSAPRPNLEKDCVGWRMNSHHRILMTTLSAHVIS